MIRDSNVLVRDLCPFIEWLENIYFPTNLKRLREHLEIVTKWLEKNELPFVRPVGGLYIFVNFSKVSE